MLRPARVAPALLLALLMLSSFLAVRAGAYTAGTISATVIPAPLGYAFVFNNPSLTTIYGYENQLNYYFQYPAQLGPNETYIVMVSSPAQVAKLYSNLGLLSVNDIFTEQLNDYLISLGGARYIIYGGGDLYESPYVIYYNELPPANATASNAVAVWSDEVDFMWRGIKVVFVYPQFFNPLAPSQASITVITSISSSRQMSLSELLGIPSSCVTWFSNPSDTGGWYAGIVDSVACTQNIQPMRTITVNGQIYIVVFGATTQYGAINYVVLTTPSVSELESLGMLDPVNNPNGVYHILYISNGNTYIYLSSSSGLTMLPTLQVTDATQPLPNGMSSCTIPNGAQVVEYLLWSYKRLNGTVDLLPGEVVLFRYNGNYYICHGDLSWLFSNSLPAVMGPRYSELVYPIHIYNPAGQPFLVVISNGVVHEATSAQVAWSTYKHNVVYVAAGAGMFMVMVHTTSLFLSPFFMMWVLVVGVVSVAISRSKAEKPVPTIKVIMDIAPPEPRSFTSDDKVRYDVGRYIDARGVCPTVLELAEPPFKDLVPIPPDYRDERPPLVCNFKTWHESEYSLREVAKVLNSGLWQVVRYGPHSGYIFTLIGEFMPYMYFYKQEADEDDKPELTVLRALESAVAVEKEVSSRSFIKVSLGLMIVVPDRNYDAVASKVEELLATAPPGSSGGRLIKVEAFLTKYGLNSRVPPDVLNKFANDKVRDIVVVSESNVTKLIEYLADNTVPIVDRVLKEMATT